MTRGGPQNTVGETPTQACTKVGEEAAPQPGSATQWGDKKPSAHH